MLIFGKRSSLSDIKAQIEAGRIPPVNLSEAQITKLKTLFPKVDRMVWSRAGRQPDGKTFVCFVFTTPQEGRTSFEGSPAAVYAGTFEADGSFQQTSGHLWNVRHVVNDCRNRGFDPPVKITGF